MATVLVKAEVKERKLSTKLTPSPRPQPEEGEYQLIMPLRCSSAAG